MFSIGPSYHDVYTYTHSYIYVRISAYEYACVGSVRGVRAVCVCVCVGVILGVCVWVGVILAVCVWVGVILGVCVFGVGGRHPCCACSV